MAQEGEPTRHDGWLRSNPPPRWNVAILLAGSVACAAIIPVIAIILHASGRRLGPVGEGVALLLALAMLVVAWALAIRILGVAIPARILGAQPPHPIPFTHARAWFVHARSGKALDVAAGLEKHFGASGPVYSGPGLIDPGLAEHIQRTSRVPKHRRRLATTLITLAVVGALVIYFIRGLAEPAGELMAQTPAVILSFAAAAFLTQFALDVASVTWWTRWYIEEVLGYRPLPPAPTPKSFALG